MNEQKRPLRLHPLWELTKTRLLEFVRETEALFWSFGFPVLLALALGIAFREAPPEAPRVLVLGSSGAIRATEGLLAGHGVEMPPIPPGEAGAALARGKVDLLVLASLAEGRPGVAVAYRYDSTRPDARAARLAVDDALQRAAGRQNPVRTAEELVKTPGSRYIDFLIPGLVGLGIMGSGMWGVGFAIVDARVRKLLKRYAATPMRRFHFLLSFILSRLFLLIPEVWVLVAFGWLLFGVRIAGSAVALVLITLVASLAFAGLGLLVAARPTTTESVMGWMNLVMLPMWVLSGSLFSTARFPEAMQPYIRVLPLTAANDAMRLVMNEGAALSDCLVPLGLLALWALVGFAVALRIFRWQ